MMFLTTRRQICILVLEDKNFETANLLFRDFTMSKSNALVNF